MSFEHNNKMNIAIAVLDENKGQAFIKDAIKLGLNGGFILPAKGLIDSKILNMLSIRNRKRQVVVLYDYAHHMIPILDRLSESYQMSKPNHGVIFLLEAHHDLTKNKALSENDWINEISPYQLLMTTFRHERRKEIIETFHQLSQEISTLITGRGEFSEEYQKVLGVKVAPQKDILLSITSSHKIFNIFKGLEDYYHFTETKGMRIHSLDVLQFSQANEQISIENMPHQLSMLVSIISEDLKDDYIEFLQSENHFGGTAVKAHGSLTASMNDKIFNMSINPQKYVVFTVDTTPKINEVYHKIINQPELNKAHQSIFFTQPIIKTFGISE